MTSLVLALCSAFACGTGDFLGGLAARRVTVLIGSTVPLAVGLALGEAPGPLALAGVVLALVATVLVGLTPHEETAAERPFTRRVALLTLGAGVSFALSFVFTGQIPAGSGLWPLFVARWAATGAVFLVAFSRGDLRPPPPGPAFGYALAVGVLDTTAHLTMMLALQRTWLSIGSVVISLFPAVTVVLAVVLRGERLTRAQLVGMALAAVGLMLIGS